MQVFIMHSKADEQTNNTNTQYKVYGTVTMTKTVQQCDT